MQGTRGFLLWRVSKHRRSCHPQLTHTHDLNSLRFREPKTGPPDSGKNSLRQTRIHPANSIHKRIPYSTCLSWYVYCKTLLLPIEIIMRKKMLPDHHFSFCPPSKSAITRTPRLKISRKSRPNCGFRKDEGSLVLVAPHGKEYDCVWKPPATKLAPQTLSPKPYKPLTRNSTLCLTGPWTRLWDGASTARRAG